MKRTPTTGLLGLLLTCLLSGCAMVPGETRVPLHQQWQTRHNYYGKPQHPDLSESYVAGVPKLHPHWWMENTDEPMVDWWRPDEPMAVRRRTWLLRNPFHNFTHYVIGVADRHRHRYGIEADSIWNSKGSFNATITKAGPLLYLPMISNRGPFTEWYIGWRTSGSFGAAIRAAQHPDPTPQPPTPQPPTPQPPTVSPAPAATAGPPAPLRSPAGWNPSTTPPASATGPPVPLHTPAVRRETPTSAPAARRSSPPVFIPSFPG